MRLTVYWRAQGKGGVFFAGEDITTSFSAAAWGSSFGLSLGEGGFEGLTEERV